MIIKTDAFKLVKRLLFGAGRTTAEIIYWGPMQYFFNYCTGVVDSSQTHIKEYVLTGGIQYSMGL